MSLEDLDFKIKGDVKDSMSSIKQLAVQLLDVFKISERIDLVFDGFGESLALPVRQIDMLSMRVEPLAETLARADKQANALEEAFTRRLMEKALGEQHRRLLMVADGTERARYEMLRLSDASQGLRSPTMNAPRISSANRSGGELSIIKVSAVAGQLALMSRVSGTLGAIRTTIAGVGRESTISAGYMDRFRMGLAAAKVDPSLNVAKNVIDSAGNSVAGFIEKARGIADATISGIPDTLKSMVTGLGAIVGSGDSATLTISKFVTALRDNQNSLKLLKSVYPVTGQAIDFVSSMLEKAVPIAEKAGDKFDAMKADVAALAGSARGLAFVATGAFAKTGTSADLLARAQYHALLPARLYRREVEGGVRIYRAAAHVFNFMTAPIHKVSLMLGHSRAEFRSLRAQLPPLTGGLQLGTRAIRIFSQGTYLASSAVRPLVPLVTGLGRVTVKAASGLISIARGAKSMVSGLANATGVQNTFIGKALGMKQSADAAAGSMAKMGNQSGMLSGMLGGATGKAMLMAGAIMALVTGAAAWGASTAVAAEKNDVVFGTMLKNMDQGKAVVDSLQNSKAAGLIDNDELLTSGRLLFKAGVSAADLAAKTDQLATIATATSTELNDLSRIYQQGAVTGSFGQDKINQLAERGIDIYHGLEAATGASGGELKKMISDGKIGLTEMDSALAHMTEGQGIYAGAIENVAGTTGGMLSQIKNNTQQALGQLMGYSLGILKPVLSLGVSITQKIKAGITALEPVFTQSMTLISAVMSTAWTSISEVASGAFTMIFGEGQMTFDSIINWAARMLGAGTYIFSNLGKFASYAWKTMQLGAAMAFNDIVYFFTDTIPAYLGWFGENWANVFMDAGMVVATVFTNIAKNIGNAMTAIWDFIASGGTAKLEFAFVPLLDGFKSTVAELPNVPERALTELEQQLSADLGALGTEIGTGLADSMAAAAAAVGSQTATELSNAGTASHDGEKAADKASKNAAENKAVHVRSTEGQGLIAQMSKAFGKGDKEKKAQDATIEQAKDMKKLVRHVQAGKPLKSKGF